MTSRMNTRYLPTKEGVGPSTVALPDGPWLTVIDFLSQRFPSMPRADWVARMERGDVLDARGMPLSVTSAYRAHTKVHYYRSVAAEPRIPFEATVLFQDELLVAVDKPHFLPVMPTGRFVQESLLVRLKQLLGLDTLVPIHRIDMETAGVVLFCASPAARDRYAALFRDRQVAKTYQAIAPWPAAFAMPRVHRSRLARGDSYMQMQEQPGPPNSETMLSILEARADLARYRLTPITGRKHQLRAHMSALGIPIANDRLYPHDLGPRPADDYTKPLQLLAESIAFVDPITRQPRQFVSNQVLHWPAPGDC
jgi:tRNA pseudouridine32 synthase / 23S rRNA pseudouridine746 synthase